MVHFTWLSKFGAGSDANLFSGSAMYIHPMWSYLRCWRVPDMLTNQFLNEHKRRQQTEGKRKQISNNWARMWFCSPIDRERWVNKTLFKTPLKDRERWVNKTLFKTPLKGNHPCPRWSIYQGRVHLQHPRSSFTHRLGTLPVPLSHTHVNWVMLWYHL